MVIAPYIRTNCKFSKLSENPFGHGWPNKSSLLSGCFWKPRQNDVFVLAIKKNDKEVIFQVNQTKMPDVQARHFIS